MSANVEGMVREGINAFKAGRKDEARALLSKAVEIDPYNEEGWLWLSGVVTSVDDQRTCLENVLAINPGNSRARSGLDFLIRQNPSAAAASNASEPPLQGATAPASPAAAGAFAAASLQQPPPIAPTETSVEWAETDSEPLDESGWHEATPPPDESYNDWVSDLQLGAAIPAAAVPDTDPFASIQSSGSPFFDDDLPEMGEEAGLFDDHDPLPDAAPVVFGPDAIAFRPPPAADDDDRIAPAAVVGATAVPQPVKSAAALNDISIDEEEILLTEEEISLFPEIPKEIKSTRMPGTKERVPLLLKIAVFILVPLNVVAAILFFWQVL